MKEQKLTYLLVAIFTCCSIILFCKKSNAQTAETESKVSVITEVKPNMSAVEYKKLVTNDKLVLIDCYAPWCGPCKKIAPLLDSVAIEMKGKIILARINMDENKNLYRTLGIENIPVVIIYKNGEEQWRYEGSSLTKQELIKAINSY